MNPRIPNTKVLIADEDPGIQALVETKLRENNYHAIRHTNLAGLYQTQIEYQPQIILLNSTDLLVIERLRSRGPDAQIIIISANHDMATVVATIKVGANDYIQKPISLPRLLQVIKDAQDRLTRQEIIDRVIKALSKAGKILLIPRF